jgi:hypothetical protein
MGKGRVVLAGALGLALLGTAGAAATARKGRQFQIDLRLLRGDPRGSPEQGTAEVLTRPTLQMLEKQEGRVFVGQEVRVAGAVLEVGNSFRAVAESAAGGKVRLRVTVEMSEVIENPATRMPAAVRTERATFTREVKPGEKLRVRLGKRAGKETWVELRAREVND